MRVGIYLFGLAALLWAQTATVWKWYGYGENNHPSPNLCTPPSNNGNGRIGVVRVLGDTVYVMGTYQRLGPFSFPLPLPKVPGDPTTASATTPDNFNTSTYLAAYDRQTGHIRWWMSFRPNPLINFNGYVEGQDFVVRPDGRIYLLLHTNPSAFSWNYQSASGSFANNTFDIGIFFTSIPLSNRVSSILEISPGSSPSVQVRRAIGVTDLSGEVHLKYLYYIRDTLYVTGDYIVLAQGFFTPWALSDDPITYLFCYAPTGCNTSGSNKSRGLIIGYQTAGSWTLIRAAEVRYEALGGAYESVKGHRLAKDPVSGRLRWVIEVEQSGPKSLIYNTNPGGASSASITPGPLSPPVTTLYAISLNPNLSLPLTPNYHQLAQRTTASLAPEPVFVETQGDSILWIRSADYNLAIMNGPGSWYTLTSLPYVAVVRQRLPNTDNYARTLAHQGLTGLSTLSSLPVISDIAVERGWDLLYLMGHAYGATGPINDLLGLPAGRNSGFLLGLRYQGGSYSLLGGTSFISHKAAGSPTGNVLLAGGAYDSLRAQFYLFGTGQDSVWVRRKWPDGTNDTTRICTVGVNASGLWLGRLDWYRIMASPQTLTRCVPDTVHPNISFAEYGTFASSIPEAPKETTYVWLPLSNPYYAYQRPAYLRATYHSGYLTEMEGIRVYSLPVWAEGRLAPGSYILTRPIWGRNHFQNDTWADVIDTIRLEVSGTTTPLLGRNTASAFTYMVTPYAGKTGTAIPDISGPYPRHRSENWKFPSISDMFYHPYYYAPPRHPGREMLIVANNVSSPSRVWGIDLATGEVWNLPAPTTGGTPPQYFPDPVRGTYWAIDQRPPLNSIFTMRLHRAPFNSESYELIKQDISEVGIRRDAYPLRYDSVWVRGIRKAVVLPNGDFVISVRDYPLNPDIHSLWRISLERDSVYRITGRATASGCAQDGVGSTSMVSADIITDFAVWRDTLFWIEDFPNTCSPTYSGSGFRALLRRAYPSGSIATYTVETMDTLYYSGSGISGYLLFSPLPTPGLIFRVRNSSSSNVVIRRDLSTGRWDTLLQCLGGSMNCCSYGLSDWISGVYFRMALLGSGALAIEDAGSIKLAVPIALAGAEDTLVTEGPVGAVSSAGGTGVTPSFSGTEIRFGWPAASGPGLDSTYLAVSLSGCANGKPRYYPFYHLPRFGVWMRGPDTVCVGQVFHTYVGRDTEVVESNCRVSHRLFMLPTSTRGYIAWERGGNETHRWRATQSGHDTIKTAIQRPKWRYLVSDSALSFPVRIRQGHRLRLSVALEGPYEATTFLHRRHPFLTRYNLAAYNQRILGVSSDSLWRLPYPPGDSLIKNWNPLLFDPNPGPCPGPGSWYCDTIWTTLARVELRESPTGPVVDSAYALVDSAGRLTSYAAPLSGRAFPMGHGDTLHFCHCDPTTPKYITVRFPHHLPLHTPAISLPVRGVGQADSLDFRDPTYLEGIPGEHYTLVPGPGSTLRAAAWAGNCADLHNAFIPGGAHVDAGWINAADYDFVILRNGVTSGFSIADLNSDGVVNSLDAVIVISNQNALRQSSRP